MTRLNKKQFLEEIKLRVYLGELSEQEIATQVFKAQEDIKKDLQSNCKHNWVTNNEGYSYDYCSKCKIMK